MKTAVLFDLDGTVLDSKLGVFRSIEYAMTKLNLPIPPENELMAFLGPPIQHGFDFVCHVPKDNIEMAIRYYREYYNGGGKFGASIYSGVAETVQKLHQLDKMCYITTSKPQVFAKEILEHFGILELFDGVYGCELDGTRSSKEDVLRYCLKQHQLQAEDVVLVGDRLYDVNGAAALSMDCIGILYGYGTEDELKTAGATYICADTDELYALLSRL